MSTIKETEWIWRDGEFVRWQDATVHILSTAVQFGSSVFEGIRCYDTERGPAIFRLREHLRRLRNSARIYRMEAAYGDEALAEAGIVAAAIDFRHAGDGYPTSLADINYAVRWLKAHAGEYRVDPGRIGLSGQSSGGHLAMLAAMRPSCK